MYRLSTLFSITIALTLGLLVGCDSTGPLSPGESATTASQTGPPPGARGSHDLEVTALHEGGNHQFELSAQEVSSGWTTLTFNNQSDHVHFVLLNKMGETALEKMQAEYGEISREAYMDAVSIPFQEAWDPFFNGTDDANAFFGRLFAKLPGWYFNDVRPSGGVGMTAGGETAKTTVDLDPGVYFMECYVLGENGEFHSTSGMVEKLRVTETASETREPKPTLAVSISTNEGIDVHSTQGPSGIRPGMHTVGVTFEDNQLYGHGLGHDVHLIRLEGGTTVQEVNDWMNYLDVGSDGFFADTGALTSTHDHPAPQTFLGGVQDIQPPLPETAYLHVNLKPGTYAWVAEVPNPSGKKMLKTFSVPFNRESIR